MHLSNVFITALAMAFASKFAVVGRTNLSTDMLAATTSAQTGMKNVAPAMRVSEADFPTVTVTVTSVPEYCSSPMSTWTSAPPAPSSGGPASSASPIVITTPIVTIIPTPGSTVVMSSTLTFYPSSGPVTASPGSASAGSSPTASISVGPASSGSPTKSALSTSSSGSPTQTGTASTSATTSAQPTSKNAAGVLNAHYSIILSAAVAGIVAAF
ncbi:hypothetical protein ANO11243_073650 [Dothideomycetidae sp. 11243]|nr:hypothetical protein ANO11243_073650 [fungal sp. No.11243]